MNKPESLESQYLYEILDNGICYQEYENNPNKMLICFYKPDEVSYQSLLNLVKELDKKIPGRYIFMTDTFMGNLATVNVEWLEKMKAQMQECIDKLHENETESR